MGVAVREIGQGVHGEKRDDEQIHRPNLVQYSKLRGDEKDYNRNMAMETLKTIISLGYEIRKK